MTFNPTSTDYPADGLPPDQSASESALPDLGAEVPLDEALAPPAEPDESFGGESPLAEPPAASPVPLSPVDAALTNARNGRWMMNEGFDGWVLLGADGKP